MTKTLNQIICFPPPKSEYFFQQHWESEYFFRKKPYPPLQVKWSFPITKIECKYTKYLIGFRKETMSYIYLFPVLFILLYNKYYIVTDNTCRF